MISEFNRLSDSEIELMFKAPVLACILIAGADGEIDRKEIQGAIEFITKKQKKAQPNMLEFYREVGKDFEDKFKIVLQSYPPKPEDRSQMITEELAGLNKILPKLNKNFAASFYASIREIAKKIAHSSGGLLGMNKVGDEEARYMDLSMIKDPLI
jgi:hypothetical protein